MISLTACVILCILVAVRCEKICGVDGYFLFQGNCVDLCLQNTRFVNSTCFPDTTCKSGYEQDGSFVCKDCLVATDTLNANEGFCTAPGIKKCTLQIVNFTGGVFNRRELPLNLTCVLDGAVIPMKTIMEDYMLRFSMFALRKINPKEYYEYLSFVGFVVPGDVASDGTILLALRNDDDNTRDDVNYLQLELINPVFQVNHILGVLFRSPFVNYSVSVGKEWLTVKEVSVRSVQGMNIQVHNEVEKIYEDNVYTYNDMKLDLKWINDLMCITMYVVDVDRSVCKAIQFNKTTGDILPLTAPTTASPELASSATNKHRPLAPNFYTNVCLAGAAVLVGLLFVSVASSKKVLPNHTVTESSNLAYKGLHTVCHAMFVLALVTLTRLAGLHLGLQVVVSAVAYKLVDVGTGYCVYKLTKEAFVHMKMYVYSLVMLMFAILSLVVMWSVEDDLVGLCVAGGLFLVDVGVYCVLYKYYYHRMYDLKGNVSKMYTYLCMCMYVH